MGVGGLGVGVGGWLVKVGWRSWGVGGGGGGTLISSGREECISSHIPAPAPSKDTPVRTHRPQTSVAGFKSLSRDIVFDVNTHSSHVIAAQSLGRKRQQPGVKKPGAQQQESRGASSSSTAAAAAAAGGGGGGGGGGPTGGAEPSDANIAAVQEGARLAGDAVSSPAH